MDSKTIERLGPMCFGREEKRRAIRAVRHARLRPGLNIYTGTGKVNRIVKNNSDELWLTARGDKPISIKAQNIVNAVAYMFRIRTVERKELEYFHHFSSCLFGLLRTVFRNKARVLFQNRLLRLVLKGMRFFFAGIDKTPRDMKIAAGAGAKYVLASYYYLKQQVSGKWKERLQRYNLRLLLDSGAFTVWQKKLKGTPVKEITIAEYIDFIRDHKDIIEAAVVLDVIGDYRATKENLRVMEAHSPIPPIPVYHCGTPISELQELVDRGYPLIALGGTVNRSKKERYAFFKEVFEKFPNQAFHGLGVSDIFLLKTFPFFSCDSKAWIQARTKVVFLTRNGQVKGPKDTPLDLRLAAMAENVKFLAGMENPECMKKLKWPGYEQLVVFS